MPRFFLCEVNALELLKGRQFDLPDGESVVLFRDKKGIYATQSHCPHAGGNLDIGRLQKGILTCVWHGWQFQLPGGHCLGQRNVRLKTYPVEIENNKIYVIK